MMILWEDDMKGEWQSAHEWLKDYNAYEEQELDKRRLIEWLMHQEFTSEGREQPA